MSSGSEARAFEEHLASILNKQSFHHTMLFIMEVLKK
jgi:hypothetical protein